MIKKSTVWLVGAGIVAVLASLIYASSARNGAADNGTTPVADDSAQLAERWPARGNAVSDEVLVEEARMYVASERPASAQLHLLWAVNAGYGNFIVMFAWATDVPDHFAGIRLDKHGDRWGSRPVTFRGSDPAISVEFGSLYDDILPRGMLLASDVENVTVHYPDQARELPRNDDGFAPSGGDRCLYHLLVEFQREGGWSSYAVPGVRRVLNQGDFSLKVPHQIDDEVTVNDLVALSAADRIPLDLPVGCLGESRRLLFINDDDDFWNVRLLGSARLADGSEGRVLAVDDRNGPQSVAWVPPGANPIATLSLGLPDGPATEWVDYVDRVAFKLASPGRTPILVVLSKGPVTTVPTLPEWGRAEEFVVFGQPGDSTGVVTTNTAGQPVSADVVIDP